MLYFIKKQMYRLLPEGMYLSILHNGFFFLYRLGILKNDERYKFHYAVQYLIEPTDYVVDMGANLGYFARTFARVAKKGRLTCIEPIPAFYSVLKKKIGDKHHVKLIHSALGKENGEITMVLPKSNGMIRTGLPHVPKEGENIAELEKTTVKLTSASKLFASIGKIDYIKCDIEGFEWVVFQEIKKSLEMNKPMIQVEISEENILPMIEMLSSIGYKQYGIAKNKIIMDTVPQKELGDFLFVHETKETVFKSKMQKLGKLKEI
jgi:FkbM family methyltransferase